MLVRTDPWTLAPTDPRRGCSHERTIEVEVLLQAISSLRREGILTEAECEAKLQRLAARL